MYNDTPDAPNEPGHVIQCITTPLTVLYMHLGHMTLVLH